MLTKVKKKENFYVSLYTHSFVKGLFNFFFYNLGFIFVVLVMIPISNDMTVPTTLTPEIWLLL